MEIFKPTIQDQATFSGSVDISGSLTITQNLNVVGELQGAATTASYISLANVDGFTAVSSSIEQRISRQELFSQSLDDTFATDQQVSDAVSSLNAATSSYALQADISGAFASTSESLAGRITPLEGSVSALNLASSSYLLNTTDTLTGDLTVTGKITAQEFHTEFVSASIIYESGSTQFGDSADDTHIFTGNVGIGTSSPTSLIHIRNTSYGTALAQFETSGRPLTLGAQSSYVYMGYGNREQFKIAASAGDGRFILGSSLSDDGNNTLQVNGTSYFAGNVGIGTNSPSQTLDVVGDAIFSSYAGFNGVTSPEFPVDISAVDGGKILRSTRGTSVFRFDQSNDGPGYIGMQSNDDFSIQTNNTSKIYIKADGNVGIGTTSPARKLTIADGTGGGNPTDSRTKLYIDANTESYISFNMPADSFEGIRMAVAGTNKATLEYWDNVAQGKKLWISTVSTDPIVFATNNSPRMYIQSDGNVGIGTTNPSSYKLHVNNSTEDILNLHNTTDGLDSLISFTNPGGTLARIQGLDNGGLQIDTGNNAGGLNSNVINLSNTGNVGINRTSPLYKLHVEGDAGVNSIVLSNSSTSTFGTMSKVYQDYSKRSFVLNHSFTYTGAGTYYFNLAFPNPGAYGYDLRLVTGRSGNYRNFGYIKHSGQLYWESDGDFAHYTSGTFDTMSSADGGMTASVNSAYGANNINDNSQGTLNWSYYIVRYAITFPNGTTGNDGWFKVHLDTFNYAGDTAYFVKD